MKKMSYIICSLLALASLSQAETYNCSPPVDSMNRPLFGNTQFQVISDADAGVSLIGKDPGSPFPTKLLLQKQTTSRAGNLSFSAQNESVKFHNYYANGAVNVAVSLSIVSNNDIYSSSCK